MRFEVSGTVTYHFTAEIEADDWDEALIKQRMHDFENVELDDCSAELEPEEIDAIEEDE